MEQIRCDETSRLGEIRTNGGRRFYYHRVPADSSFKFTPSLDLSWAVQIGEAHLVTNQPGLHERIAPCPGVLRRVAPSR